MSPVRAKETNGHHRPIVLFRPFRAGEYDYRIPRAALRLPWADMFLALQADLCRTTGDISALILFCPRRESRSHRLQDPSRFVHRHRCHWHRDPRR